MANANTHANANAGGRAIAVNGRRYLPPSQPAAAVFVDGCEFDYLEAAAAARVAPFIGKMLKGGWAFKGDCVIPSFTNPNNLSIVCGVPPLVHGICGNYFEQAVPFAVQGSYKNCGHRCTAVERMLVQQRVAADFTERVVEKTRAWSFGDPFDGANPMGTEIDVAAAQLFEARVNDVIARGARLRIGNERRGALYSPTVLDGVDPAMTLVREETFGPVSPIIAFDTLDDAIRISNGTPFGLSSRWVRTGRTRSRALSTNCGWGRSTFGKCRVTGES